MSEYENDITPFMRLQEYSTQIVEPTLSMIYQSQFAVDPSAFLVDNMNPTV